MKNRKAITACFVFCMLVLFGCDTSEQKVDVDSICAFNSPLHLESLNSLDPPLIEKMKPVKTERFQRSFVNDWVKWEYMGTDAWITVNIMSFREPNKAEKYFQEGVEFRTHYRYDQVVDRSFCRMFVSGVKALRGDVAPTKTGKYTSEIILQSGNVVMRVWESSSSEYGDIKSKPMTYVAQQLRLASK